LALSYSNIETGVSSVRVHRRHEHRPGVERMEARLPPSAVPSAALLGGAIASKRTSALQVADSPPTADLTLYRIINPNPFNAQLIPPFRQVLVQATKPVPGAVYNVLSISVRNGTARTFDASNGFSVRVTGQSTSLPILTGSDEWKPGQVMVFY